jgi:iron(III) transport system permease protein
MNTTITGASLEQPGKWRIVGVVLVLLVVILPALPLLWHTTTTTDVITWPFSGSFGVVGNSLLVGLTVAAVSFLFGLPIGVLLTFYEFPGRRILFALATLPLLVPSVLWAIGWSALVARLAPTATDMLSGITGCADSFMLTNPNEY